MPKHRRRKFTSVERTLEITALGRHGEGMAEHESGRHFIPFALPGETVRATISGKKAELDEVLVASPDRIDPFCKYFGQCGGCAVQHLKQDDYQNWKRGIVETALRHKQIDLPVEPLVDGHGTGRRRVTLHAQYIKGGVLCGFMKGASHQLLDLKNCPILTPELDNVTDVGRRLATPFASAANKINMQITATDTGLDCDVQGAGKMTYDAHVALAKVADECDIARISIDGEMALERRKPTIKMGLANVTPSSGGFLQATYAGEETLDQLALDYIDGAKNIADLFCGIGPFALRAAQKTTVTGYDNNEPAIAALSNAIRHTPGLKPLNAIVQDLFQNPVYHRDLEKFDAVIFDPPRAGALEQVREIVEAEIPKVVSISCDPASFARDAEVLIDGGYTLEKIIPVDQFKYSSHIEIVGCFKF